MPQVKYSNFRLYCLPTCITDLKSHTEALLFPLENVLSCKGTYFSRGLPMGYHRQHGSVWCYYWDRNKIDWRSEFVLVTVKTQGNSVPQAVFSMTQLVMILCPTTVSTCTSAVLKFLSPSSRALETTTTTTKTSIPFYKLLKYRLVKLTVRWIENSLKFQAQKTKFS